MLDPAAPLLSALVVDPDDGWRAGTEALLGAAGFTVIGAATYKEALPLLLAATPSLLITEVRLGAYNGLQLAIRGRAERPGIALIVASGFHDAVLQRESEQFGATFVEKPVTPEELFAAVQRTLARPGLAGGAAEPIRPPFERRRIERRQMVMAIGQDIAIGKDVAFGQDRRQMERRRGLSAAMVGAVASS